MARTARLDGEMRRRHPHCCTRRVQNLGPSKHPVSQLTVPRAGGTLRDSVLAFPRLMQEAGYHTYMAGKWHIGRTKEQSPVAHGFESSFAMMGGGDVHFRQGVSSNAIYLENGENAELPEDFYSTEYYTDKMLEFLQSNEGDGKPFFAWYTPTSPHWPLQAHASSE